MKSPPWLYPQFISPMSGRINTSGVQALLPNYTFIGDNNGFVLQSPILIDIRLELARLRNLLGTTPFLLQEAIAGFDNSQPLNQVLNGLIMNEGGFIVPASLTENNFWVGSPENLPIETSTIPGGAISLLYNNVFVGNASNLATAQPTIQLGNLPNLTYHNIWRGDITNRPIESDSLTTTESSLSDTITTLSNLANIVNAISSTVDALSSSVAAIEGGIASFGGFAAIILLQAQVLGLIGAVASLGSRMDNAESDIDTLQGQVSTINTQISTINSQISSINSQLLTINSQLSTINSQLSTINSQLSTINSEITTINTNISSINSQLVLINSQISTIITDINNLANAPYIIQTADSTLPNAQVLASLSTGIVKNTTTTGVLSIATAGTDYYSPGNPTILIEDYTFDIDPLMSFGNLGMGTHVLHSLTLFGVNTGNTGLGSDCLYSFTTGSANTSSGRLSLYSLVSGTANTVGGYGGGYLITSGTNNTLYGALSGFSMITGTGNSFFGYQTGQHDNLTDCCFFGRGARSSSDGLTNAIAIGATATVNTSNSMVLGNNVSVGIGTTSPAYPLDVVGVAGISINVNTNRIINVNTPISGLDAANKNYVDSSTGSISNATYIIQVVEATLPNAQVLASLSTGIVKNTTTTGVLSIATAGTDYYSPGHVGTPIATNDAANKIYVDNSSISLSGAVHGVGTVLGGVVTTFDFSAVASIPLSIFSPPVADISMNSFKITNLATSTAGTDAANKNYVDSSTASISGAKYIIQTTLAALPNAQVLASLSTGIVKNTTTTGVLSIATPGTDYYSSGHPTTITTDTVNQNVSLSTNAFASLSGGTGNAIFNVFGGQSITSGVGNCIFAAITGQNITTGGSNVLIANGAGSILTTGGSNILIGSSAGSNLTTPNFNVFIGSTSGGALSTGGSNTGIGTNAGTWGGGGSATYDHCVFIGNNSTPSTSNISNAISIGNNSSVATSNTIVMGDSTITTFNIPGIHFGLTANTITSTNTNGNITVTPNGTGIISLSSNVGINETSPTYARLCLVGGVQNVTSEDSIIRASSSSLQAKIELNNTTASTGKLYELRSGSTGGFDITDRTGTATRFLINTSGNIGVAEGTPTYAKLCVLGGVANVASEDSSIRATGSSNATKIEINNTSASGRLYELRSDNVGTFAIADRTGAVTNRLIINSSGFVGIGSGANAPLQFAAVNANRKIVFVEVGNNDHQVTALGAPSTGIRFQVNDTAKAFIFFAGTSSTTSNELARITGGGALLISRIANDVNSPSVTPTVSLGAVGVVGTGATSSFVGGEVGGRFTLNTGTGVLTTGTIATFTLASAMPSSTFSVIFYPASGAISLNANSTSSTQFTISNTGLIGLAASTTYIWNYQIVGY